MLLRPSHPVHGHLKGIKEEDGAQVAIGFPSSDDGPLSEDTELPPSQVSPQPTGPVSL